MFDATTGEPISEDEQARRKKAATSSFDGNPDGQNHGGQVTAAQFLLQGTNVEEQIRAIHQKFAAPR